MAYQHTPDASKGNAFCWMSWQQRIDWRRSTSQENGARRTQEVEAKRAAGKDPLFIPGMGSAVRQHPLDPARFTVFRKRKEAHRA